MELFPAKETLTTSVCFCVPCVSVCLSVSYLATDESERIFILIPFGISLLAGITYGSFIVLNLLKQRQLPKAAFLSLSWEAGFIPGSV